MSTFCAMWHDEVHHQLLAKGALFMNDPPVLDSVVYLYFISALIALRETIQSPFYIPFCSLFKLYFKISCSLGENIKSIVYTLPLLF